MTKILVSACLLGCKVRYDGKDLAQSGSDFNQVIDSNEIIPFCPEVSGGLPIPRIAAEIKDGTGFDVLANKSRIVGKDGSDVTEPFIEGAKLALELCQSEGVQQAILAEASPSCGSSYIYNGQFEGKKIAGQGVTCANLQKHGIKVVSQHQVLQLSK